MWGAVVYPIILLLFFVYCGVVAWSARSDWKLPKFGVDIVQKNPLEEMNRRRYGLPGSVIEPKTDQEITAAQIIDENLKNGRDTPIEDIL